ncbi:MAG: type II toxin-antitoxin system PrlF family antitoxin [Alphaproteobacteria bacterium]|jgi:antitoxin PrlF|uniref:type II toxin-antitoxin system PrlF family antitoxin n=1 Tax=Rhizobium/Agrobacterium group TaxID=227290 RepID=UPI0006B91C0D|nr:MULTISPECIES: type II toxin-antitoxin system PrlF family antitoxin [Rhizobium/Agrobacterium group]MBU0736744.1 type II toxin-antitoxin system PrlF family antitoxin [Alphaproteobacteria bacterium]MDZ7874502.1 type II toxin-antitoxin system PrlF family antitoxin [Rhizobium sp.]AOG09022.1 putative protease, htra suppressor [Agrobacterium sp. RAC06]KPF57923.1 regulator [Rhizobium sp. AAP116]MBU0831598.1 type II toxin-antitoxin system PrlF family antitoxin [Alphaproteobacteria bacterium]
MTMRPDEISKLTDRYQTTVPTGVRKQLQLRKGDQIRYRTDASGRVYIEAMAEERDPALGSFLDLLERDVMDHPERLKPMEGALVQRIGALVGDIAVDLDAPLSPEDE